MTKKLMRGLVPVMVLSAAAALFTGCGSKEAPADTTQAGGSKETEAAGSTAASENKETESKGSSSKDTLIIATANETPSVTTNLHNAVAGDYINQMTHNSLFYTDENLEPQPCLVESYEIVSDTEWVFKLKQGVKFHNGEELKASDVKFSLERAKEMPRVKQYVEQIDSITVEDDHNLTLHLAEPYAPLLAALSHTGTSIVPEAAVTAQGDAFWENPIGTGPMQFVEWVPNDHYSLKRFDDYFKGPGKTTSLTLRIMPEGGARTIALETGEIDMSISVDATDVQNVKANKELMALEKTSVSVEYLAMNCEKEPFNDPKVRQAINYALNQQEIIDVVLEGRGQVANSVMNVNIPGYSEEITGYSQDLEKAKALMAEAGYPDGFKTTLFASGDVRNREAQIIQAQLLEIGIEVDIQLYEWGAFLDAINKGEHDMFISSWSNATMDPDASIFPLFHTKNFGATGNRAFYSNPEVDTLIEQAQKESDNAKRMELYKEIQQKINDDAPWVCLFYGTTCTGIRADLKGFVLHPSSANHYENLYYEK